VDTLWHLLALHVTPADAQDRAQVELLAALDALATLPVGGALVAAGLPAMVVGEGVPLRLGALLGGLACGC
jgi:hypothetical protein